MNAFGADSRLLIGDSSKRLALSEWYNQSVSALNLFLK
jgi:hypothetical protein